MGFLLEVAFRNGLSGSRCGNQQRRLSAAEPWWDSCWLIEGQALPISNSTPRSGDYGRPGAGLCLVHQPTKTGCSLAVAYVCRMSSTFASSMADRALSSISWSTLLTFRTNPHLVGSSDIKVPHAVMLPPWSATA
jgi:hypothetical protein